MNEEKNKPDSTLDSVYYKKNNKKTYIPPAVLELMKLGDEGKLWTLEIPFTLDGVTSSVRKRNLTGEQVMKLRMSIFQCGITKPIAAGEWIVIHPMDILNPHLIRQARYIPE